MQATTLSPEMIDSNPGAATQMTAVSSTAAIVASGKPKKPQAPNVGALGCVEALTDAEYVELMACEEVIRTGWRTFLEVGRALSTIRTKELFKSEYLTFEAYYHAKWHLQHSQVYRWITAAEVCNSLAALPDMPKPEHESQLRPLYPLTTEQRQSAWQAAAAKAAGRPITERLVKEAVVALHLPSSDRAAKHAVIEERIERRRLLRENVTDLLRLIMSKAGYEVLLEKAAALDGHVRFLFPEPHRKKVGKPF
jgi:hypothetical protein